MQKLSDQQLIERILREGKPYDAAPLPEGVARGPIGKCFDVTLLLALQHPHLRYVEGAAFVPHGSRQWILHAWLTDGKHAYDTTWYALDKEKNVRPVQAAYVGIEMDARAVARFVAETEYAGVLANAWRHPELAKAAAGKIL